MAKGWNKPKMKKRKRKRRNSYKEMFIVIRIGNFKKSNNSGQNSRKS